MRTGGGRFLIDLPSPRGPAEVEVRIRRDFVEIWHRDRCDGIFDRGSLRHWLRRPTGRLSVDEVTLLALKENRVGLVLERAGAWSLTGEVVSWLRSRV
jgi:hypothetical protein